MSNASLSTVVEGINVAHVEGQVKNLIAERFSPFLDSACTATNKGTFYNSESSIEDALVQAHIKMLQADRGMYALSLMLPGITEFSRMTGIFNLLNRSIPSSQLSILSDDMEKKVIKWLSRNIKITRLLRLMEEISSRGVNNKRTVRFILQSILSNKKSLAWWAVKYNRKIAKALTHAWGVKRTGVIRSICNKYIHSGFVSSALSKKEEDILLSWVFKYVNDSQSIDDEVIQCVAFILGLRDAEYTIPILKGYVLAKEDLKYGKGLPLETLRGICAIYHKNVTNEDLLKFALEDGNASMSEQGKMRVVRAAQTVGVDVQFDPNKIELVDLYKYAFEMGMTEDIEVAILKKCGDIAASLPFKFKNPSIVLDASLSMAGSSKHKNHPISVGLALCNVIAKMSEGYNDLNYNIVVSSGIKEGMLVRPCESTSLGMDVLKAFETNSDAVFIISDGYDNSPAGRTSEVIKSVRGIGINTPIYHICPVSSGASGTKKFEGSDVATMSISSVEGLAIGMIRIMIKDNPEESLKLLLNMTLPALNA